MYKKLPFTPLFFLVAGCVLAFFPAQQQPYDDAPRTAACDLNALTGFHGYTFLKPEIVDVRSAYAPLLTSWGQGYQQLFDTIDFQKKENVEEWASRFCDLPAPEHIEEVIYKVRNGDLIYLRDLADRKRGSTDLGFPFKDNTFAHCITFNGCTEVVDYLLFARECEPLVTPLGKEWKLPQRDYESMQALIRKGKKQFAATKSNFLRMRYAYQVIRMAHYAGQWQQTEALFDELMPKIDKRQPTVIYFWALGHVAGAMQQMGRYAEAAYRYTLVFGHCSSKRTQAFRSFKIRNDAEWKSAYNMCTNDRDRSTMYLLRAGHSPTTSMDDLYQVYALDPANPQLSLLLINQVQRFEKIFLRTPVTDKKYGIERVAQRQDKAAVQLLALQQFTRKITAEGKADNILLWSALDGYLELLAGDTYAAEQSFKKTEKLLPEAFSNDYADAIQEQIDIWRLLADILGLDDGAQFNYAKAFAMRDYKTFKKHPDFEPFLNDFLAQYYASTRHPGKEMLLTYGPQVLVYNPNEAALADLLREAERGSADFQELALAMDTSAEHLVARLMEAKGVAHLNHGEPEAALLALRSIPSGQQLRMDKFYPFKEYLKEKVYTQTVVDSLHLTRLEFVEKLYDLELHAKAAEAVDAPEAAWYYYFLGMGYYNTSFFGYEWEVRDYYRAGANWSRIAQGPVFPMRGTPDGNYEVTDISRALEYFERSLSLAQNSEMAARAAFWAARCRQKQWFVDKDCRYHPGNKLVPKVPDEYNQYYQLLLTKYRTTDFFKEAVKECKWLGIYAG
jgi:hypothetical protein